jgi:hypothetical protein
VAPSPSIEQVAHRILDEAERLLGLQARSVLFLLVLNISYVSASPACLPPPHLCHRKFKLGPLEHMCACRWP